MDPITITVICAVAFGAVAALSVFIRQLILSRDKRLNDLAQQRALSRETKELEKLREQMQSEKRFNNHHQILGANKESIQYYDQRINEILQKKSDLIMRYSGLSLKESDAILAGDLSHERKNMCDRLREEIDREVAAYDAELLQMQQRRSAVCESHRDLESNLLKEERERNKNLDEMYHRHTGVLEKVFLRHTDDVERVALRSIDAGTYSYGTMLLAPFRFLTQFFKSSGRTSSDRFEEEKEARDDVASMEDAINGTSTLEVKKLPKETADTASETKSGNFRISAEYSPE